MTTISFEFFPPKSIKASFRLWDTIRALAPLEPSFVSVTYGAGGTTRSETHDAVETIGKNYGLNVAAHLTCVDATREETLTIARRYAEAGVREIVALRGDTKDGGLFRPHPDGFVDSCELITALADTGQFDIRVGAYPDPHPESAYDGADIDWLKRKVDAGATSAITQFFFEADTFFRFRDACRKAGIEVPILPGILPITNWGGTVRFAGRCGATVPAHLHEAFGTAEENGKVAELAQSHCIDLCTDLLRDGVDHLHFYTLNRPEMTQDVVKALGLAPSAGRNVA